MSTTGSAAGILPGETPVIQPLSRLSALMRSDVLLSDGSDGGRVIDLMVNPQGMIEYLAVFENQNLYLVPFSAVAFDPADRTIQLAQSPLEMRNVMRFPPSEWPDLTDNAMRDQILNFWGVPAARPAIESVDTAAPLIGVGEDGDASSSVSPTGDSGAGVSNGRNGAGTRRAGNSTTGTTGTGTNPGFTAPAGGTINDRATQPAPNAENRDTGNGDANGTGRDRGTSRQRDGNNPPGGNTGNSGSGNSGRGEQSPMRNPSGNATSGAAGSSPQQPSSSGSNPTP